MTRPDDFIVRLFFCPGRILGQWPLLLVKIIGAFSGLSSSSSSQIEDEDEDENE